MSILLFFGQPTSVVGRSLATPYQVKKTVGRSAAFGYKVGGRAGRSLTLSYKLGGRAAHTVRLPYRIGGATGTTPLTLSDLEIARLPFPSAQDGLGTGVAPSGERYLASAGWHGTILDPERGSFALVGASSALATLVGHRVRVQRADTAALRAVYVYVVAAADTDEPFSLARRAFLDLSLLSDTRIPVLVEVLA